MPENLTVKSSLGSGNSLLHSGNKQLTEKMLTQIYVATSVHQATGS